MLSLGSPSRRILQARGCLNRSQRGNCSTKYNHTRGRRTYLPRNIFKVLPARGRRTYLPRNIFKVMRARCRRIHLSRNFFQESPARCSGTNIRLPPNSFKCWRLVLVGHWLNGPGIRGIFAAAPPEMISAFTET